ncbi:MAG: hypothetical protein IPO48_13330 [Saprospiraceae bacterium]|nr:hypothetical protein [Saprospiraceae bacterium]
MIVFVIILGRFGSSSTTSSLGPSGSPPGSLSGSLSGSESISVGGSFGSSLLPSEISAILVQASVLETIQGFTCK